jgi:type IV pilus assembly protein PilY1
MQRISTRSNTDPAPEPAVWPYKVDPTLNPWLMSTLLSTDAPITASAAASIDEDENIWVYFGTGKYYDNSDQTDTSTQYFYGIKDSCAYGVCNGADEVISTDLYNASSIVVKTNKEVEGAAALTWDDFVNEVQVKDGWYLNLDTTGERVLNRPSILGGLVIFSTFIPDADVCSFGGTGKFYALYYETGTAHYKDVIGTETYGSDEKSLKSVNLGQGVTSDVGIHVGRKSSSTGFIQQSTGTITQIDVTPVFSIKSGIIAWHQK